MYNALDTSCPLLPLCRVDWQTYTQRENLSNVPPPQRNAGENSIPKRIQYDENTWSTTYQSLGSLWSASSLSSQLPLHFLLFAPSSNPLKYWKSNARNQLMIESMKINKWPTERYKKASTRVLFTKNNAPCWTRNIIKRCGITVRIKARESIGKMQTVRQLRSVLRNKSSMRRGTYANDWKNRDKTSRQNCNYWFQRQSDMITISTNWWRGLNYNLHRQYGDVIYRRMTTQGGK